MPPKTDSSDVVTRALLQALYAHRRHWNANKLHLGAMRVLRKKPRVLADYLAPSVMDKILEAGDTRRYKSGQLIQQRGDATDTMSFILSGSVIAGNHGLDGTFLASALLMPGEYFGDFTLFAGVRRTQNLWTQEPTELAQVPGAGFLKLLDQEPSITRALLTIATLRSCELVEFLDSQRRLPLATRIAQRLLTAVDHGSRTETIECRHEDLAFMLGVSRVAIGKALKRLQAGGLIELGYGRIHLPDVEQLRAKIDEESPLLPLQGV